MQRNARRTADAPTPPADDRLLTTAEAAEFFGLSVRTLQAWRQHATGPRFVQLGENNRSRVRYRLSDLRAFAADSMIETIPAPGVRHVTER